MSLSICYFDVTNRKRIPTIISNKKQERKQKLTKNHESRKEEVDKIMDSLLEFGFPIDNPGVQALIKIAKDFEEFGQSSSGKIKISGFQRVGVYVFSNQPHVHSHLTLVHDRNI